MGQTKPLDDYTRQRLVKYKADYYQANKHIWWESAWRERGILTARGKPFTLASYTTLLARQQGRCAFCGNTQDQGFSVSFHPVTKRARGLACLDCAKHLPWLHAHLEVIRAHLR